MGLRLALDDIASEQDQGDWLQVYYEGRNDCSVRQGIGLLSRRKDVE